jgi:hypothetical protein
MKVKPPETLEGCVEMNYTFMLPKSEKHEPIVKIFRSLIKDARVHL